MKPKPVKEKAEYWLNDNIAGWTDTQLQCLITLLREQDRDTRHACASKCLEDLYVDNIRAHDICINMRLP